MRWLLLCLIACGRSSGSGGGGAPDAAGSGAPDSSISIDASVDAKTSVTAAGPCTYIDQPGWLSCPEGMSCECYYHYYKLFENQPAQLETIAKPMELDIVSGTIPKNDTYSFAPAMIPLDAMGNGNSVYPYQVTGKTIQIYATGGYVPPNDVLFGDSDCGNQGQILQCTFTLP